MLKIGVGKGDITAYHENAAMLGYAMFHHIMKDVETPLYARTFLFQNDTTKICFVNCELGFITPAIKKGVLKELRKYHSELGYSQENLLISAQHTHCAPGGYSYYSLYNTAVPGFIHEVYEKIVSGIIDSILAAESNQKNGKIFIEQGEFEPETTISFNRSVKAYNRNKDVEPVLFADRHLATDRRMTLLKMVDEHGVEIGSINWFAVHTTSLSNNFYRVCSDNKGYASKYLERDKQTENKDYLGIFAQGNCGDVSPKWIYNPKHPFQRGKYEGKYPDDLKSAKYSGHVQYEKAREISNEIKSTAKDVGNTLDSGILYVDFSDINIDNKFVDGLNDCVTSPACMGVSMLEGSHYDGPGMHPFVGFFAKGLSKLYRFNQRAFVRDQVKKEAYLRKFKAQGVKNIALESVTHRIFMAKHARKFLIPGWIDETIGNIKHFDVQGAYELKPWTPQILPLQIIRLGNIAICGFPFEITTIAGKRLQKTLEDALIGKNGYEHVILCPYSNAYSGYITTTEEYQEQMYEAGHCVFGQWTLNAVQQTFHSLASQMLLHVEQIKLSHDILPPDFTEEELEKIKHFESATARKEKKKAEKRRIRLEKHAHRMNKRIKAPKL
ncbi:MAG: neutral/alkaline non-lysosomal ceramidase N-terminal domain-containing protein [Chitinophagales bacterium]